MDASSAPGPGTLPVLAARPAPDAGALVVEAVTVAFGLVALGLEVLLRAGGAGPRPLVQPDGRPAAPEVPAAAVVDVVLGLGWGVARAGGRVAQVGGRAAAPVARLVLDPPLVPTVLRPSTGIERARALWQDQRPRSVQALGRWTGSLAPDTVGVAFDLVDVDALIASVVGRVDVPAVVDQVLARLDLDEIVRNALLHLDLDAATGQVLERLDLERVVADVVARIEVAALVDQVLAEIDLTALVLEKVDLGVVVNDALDQLDLTALVMTRVDLAAVAEQVVEEIDLPELIRESSGSIAYETVQGIRLQGVDADRAVSRLVDRVLLRRGGRRTVGPGATPQAADEPETDGTT